MNRFLNRLQKCLVLLVVALGAASVVVGCCHHCGSGKHNLHNLCTDNCADIPKGSIPLPAGSYLRAYNARQENKAEMDDFVIYTNEWSLDDDLELGPWGAAHLGRIIMRLPASPFLVMIQPDDRAELTAREKVELNVRRRAKIITDLENAGIFDAPSRVVVLMPGAEGLFGDEAESKYQQMLSPQNQGASGGGALGGLGSFSGGAFSGGGLSGGSTFSGGYGFR